MDADLLPPVLTAALFLAVFGGALGGRIRHIEGLPYLTFILPGLLVMTVAGQTFGNCATSLFQAKNERYIEDVLTSPLRAHQVAAAYLSGGLLRGLLAALLVAAIGAPFADEGAQPALAALALLLAGLVFASLGVIPASGPRRSTSTLSSPTSSSRRSPSSAASSTPPTRSTSPGRR